tara:strand:+ start:5738 stop:6133 length:396 start_codon:yes stop_codon:yes gene_type:complete
MDSIMTEQIQTPGETKSEVQKVKNPLTNRMVSVTSKIGRELMKKEQEKTECVFAEAEKKEVKVHDDTILNISENNAIIEQSIDIKPPKKTPKRIRNRTEYMKTYYGINQEVIKQRSRSKYVPKKKLSLTIS